MVVCFTGVGSFLFLFFFPTPLLPVSYPFSVIFAITSGPVSKSRDINHDYGALKRREPPSFAWMFPCAGCKTRAAADIRGHKFLLVAAAGESLCQAIYLIFQVIDRWKEEGRKWHDSSLLLVF